MLLLRFFTIRSSVDACNVEHDDTMTEREQSNSFNNYYHESDSSKASSLYKDSGNYTIRDTFKNARNKVVTVEMQDAEMDAPKARFHIIVEPSLCMLRWM